MEAMKVRKRMRWGRARRCGGGSGGERDDVGGGEEDDAAGWGFGGEMVGAMEVVAPLYMMGRFGHVHGHVLPHNRGLAYTHVYTAQLVS